MDRATSEVTPEGGAVVHLVGKLTDATFGFIGPTTNALAQCGIHQTVILVTDPPQLRLLPKFHQAVRLELAPAGTGFLRQLWKSLDSLCTVSSARPVAAIHLHGFVPCTLAIYAVWFRGVSPKLFILSQGSRPAWVVRAASVLLKWAVRPFSQSTKQTAIADSEGDKPPVPPIQLVDHPIDASFFMVDRVEARHPLLVTSSRRLDPVGAALFAQMAVLLGEDAMQLSFNWVGPTDKESMARLKAANVGIFEHDAETERASKLSAGWMYVAHAGSPGFPVRLIEAMAAGVPCIAWNTPEHRDVLRHGETGFLCSNDAEMLARVAQLMDSPELRTRISSAAQAEAKRRFHPDKFRDFALETYSLS
ncbi:MAG TPA: glycosyltransferase [Rhizobacter sp.]|nr:glycosyltransferase [Rhizobacter sp.]